MIVEDLIMEKCLGKGAYGEVYLTRKKGTETKFATKRIDKRIANSEKYQKYFQNEREILKELDHKNILKLIEIKENSRFYFLVKEYCNGGSLRDCLKRYQEEHDKPFSQEIIQHIIRQIVDVLKYLHSINIIHRNLKLENILVIFDSEEDKDNLNMLKSTIKLNDFFFATRKTHSSHQTVVGSPYNMDPIILEIMKAKGKPCMNLGYDEKADIWSLGSIFYELLIGKTVFHSDNLESLIREADNGKYTLPYSTPKEILSFINGMLQYESEDRLSAEELSSHEYLNKNVKDFQRIDISKLRNNIGKNGLIIDFKNHGTIYEVFNTKNNSDDNLKNEENNIIPDSQNSNNNNSVKFSRLSQYDVEEINGDNRGNNEIINRNINENTSCNPIINNDTNNYNSGETDIKNRKYMRDSCLSKDTNSLLEDNLKKSIDSSKLLMRNLQDNQNAQNNQNIQNSNLYNSNNFYTNDGIQNSMNNNLNNNNYYYYLKPNNINLQGSNNYNMNDYNNINNQNNINNNINNNLNDNNMMNNNNKIEESHGGDFMLASDNSEVEKYINKNMQNNSNNNNMLNNSNNNNNNMINNSNNNMINNSNNNNMINNSNNNNYLNNSNNNNMINNSNNNNMINNSNNYNMINNSNNNNMINNSHNDNMINNSNNNNMINNSNNNNMLNNSNNNNMLKNSNNNNMINYSNNNNMMHNSNNNNMLNNSNNNMINNSNQYNNSNRNSINRQNSNNNNINDNYSQNTNGPINNDPSYINNKNSFSKTNYHEEIYTFKGEKVSTYKNSFNMKFTPGVRQSMNNADNRFINFDANSECSFGNNMNNKFGKNASVNNNNFTNNDF